MEQVTVFRCCIAHRMDFQQSLIATVHDYGLGNLNAISFNKELQQRPTALLIPCLMEEFSRPALGLIRDTLSRAEGPQRAGGGTGGKQCRRRQIG